MKSKGGIQMDKIYKTIESTISTESNASDHKTDLIPTDNKGSYFIYPGLHRGEMKPLIYDIAEVVCWITISVIFTVMLFQIV